MNAKLSMMLDVIDEHHANRRSVLVDIKGATEQLHRRGWRPSVELAHRVSPLHAEPGVIVAVGPQFVEAQLNITVHNRARRD